MDELIEYLKNTKTEFSISYQQNNSGILYIEDKMRQTMASFTFEADGINMIEVDIILNDNINWDINEKRKLMIARQVYADLVNKTYN